MIVALLDHLWQSTLFCGAVWLITLALRTNRAAVRHGLWFIASVKFLVPFTLLYALGASIGLPVPPGADPDVFGNALDIATPVVSVSGTMAGSAGSPSGIHVALLLAWSAGVGLMSARWYMGWLQARAVVRASVAVDDDHALDVRVSALANEPAVARVFRPLVLLPAGLREALDDSQLRAVYAHEREHIARHDNLTGSVHMLVETLFWFHPLVWWIGRRLVEEREGACDEAVIERGCESTDYAASILAVCRHCSARERSMACSAISGDLPQRIRRILGAAQPRGLGFLKAAALSTGAVLLVSLPLAAGALDDQRARRQSLLINARALRFADVDISPASGGIVARNRIAADDNVVLIRNTTLRDLVATAYGVEPWQIRSGEGWLDSPRYDIRATARIPVAEPDRLDPHALRGLVAELLATRFSLEIHVNQRCQSPCGPSAAGSAMAAATPAP